MTVTLSDLFRGAESGMASSSSQDSQLSALAELARTTSEVGKDTNPRKEQVCVEVKTLSSIANESQSLIIFHFLLKE